MTKKIVSLLILLAAAVFISGCIDNKNDDKVLNQSDFILQKGLPSGFTYMGTHDANLDINGIPLKAMEGVYRTRNGEDLYIQVILNYSPDARINDYKKMYEHANYNPFKEVTFNGHSATRITDYRTVNGKQTPYYTLIWAVENFIVIVGQSADENTVMALATATGH